MGILLRVHFGRSFREGRVEINHRRSKKTAEVALSDLRSWIEQRR